MDFSRLPLAAIAPALLFISLTFSALPSAAQSDEGVPVRTGVAGEQAVQRIVQLTGTVTSARTAQLSAATGGIVTALHVDAGSEVAAGDVLLELDAELAQWQWQSAQASADAARIGMTDAQRRLDEARSLAPKMSIAETAVRDLEAEVAQDTAQLQQAEAEAGYRKGILQRHQLRSPFTGVVGAKLTELGEWVDPGQPVLTLIATQELRIDFPVAEDYLARIGPDSSITYTLGDNSGEQRAARVTTVVPVSNPGARTFLLRAEPVAPDPSLIPGMAVQGQLSLATGRKGVVVPRDAILKFPDGRAVVWVVNASGNGFEVSETRVDTGVVFDGMVEIVSGLAAGASIVVRGNEALQDGQQVVPQPAAQGQ